MYSLENLLAPQKNQNKKYQSKKEQGLRRVFLFYFVFYSIGV
jgi:hypothetical protein